MCEMYLEITLRVTEGIFFIQNYPDPFLFFLTRTKQNIFLSSFVKQLSCSDWN